MIWTLGPEFPQEAPNLIVGSQNDEDGLIFQETEQRAPRKSDANLPDAGRVKLPQTQAAMLLRVCQRCFQIHQRSQDGSLVRRPQSPALAAESLQEGDSQRVPDISFFRNFAAAAGERKVWRRSESIISCRRCA